MSRIAMHGFWGRLLHIDLGSGRAVYRAIEEGRLRKYLGGVGLGTSLLYEYAPAGVDPLSSARVRLRRSRERRHQDCQPSQRERAG